MRAMTCRAGGTVLAALLSFAPAVSASGDHEHGHGGEGHGHDGGHGGHHAFDFGEAAPGAEPDRSVEILARDSMRFEPDRVVVEPGETVRFVVENTGSLQHSFTLGPPAYQEHHEEEMQGMPVEEMAGHMESAPHGLVVQPGETGTLTWRFERGGPVQFACHIPGHYPAGMKGAVRIE